jgi:protein TonB
MLEARLERLGVLSEPREPVRDPPGVDLAAYSRDAVRIKADPERRSSQAESRASSPLISAGDEAQAHAAPRPAVSPVDPVYYSARELDVYPTPLTPLRFEYPVHLAGAATRGEVLVKLMLDEAGIVDQAAVIAAEPPGHFDEQARATLAAARFSPGRREGRAVKSQVTVRVTFDPGVLAGALR